MQDNKLFTIFLNFSDHLVGIGQYEAETPEESLRQFLSSTEALEGYNRDLLLKSLMPLIHIAQERGIWTFFFDPDFRETKWAEANPVLGGHIVQTDSNAPIMQQRIKNKSVRNTP